MSNNVIHKRVGSRWPHHIEANRNVVNSVVPLAHPIFKRAFTMSFIQPISLDSLLPEPVARESRSVATSLDGSSSRGKTYVSASARGCEPHTWSATTLRPSQSSIGGRSKWPRVSARPIDSSKPEPKMLKQSVRYWSSGLLKRPT